MVGTTSMPRYTRPAFWQTNPPSPPSPWRPIFQYSTNLLRTAVGATGAHPAGFLATNITSPLLLGGVRYFNIYQTSVPRVLHAFEVLVVCTGIARTVCSILCTVVHTGTCLVYCLLYVKHTAVPGTCYIAYCIKSINTSYL